MIWESKKLTTEMSHLIECPLCCGGMREVERGFFRCQSCGSTALANSKDLETEKYMWVDKAEHDGI